MRYSDEVVASGAQSRRLAGRTIGLLLSLVACGGLAVDGPGRDAPGLGAPRDAAGDEDDDGRAPAPEPEAASGRSRLDATLDAIAADLQSVASDDRRYMRYVVVSHLSNTFDARSDRADTAASDVEGAREVRRLAVTKLVNSTSLERDIRVPSPIGPERLYQRIDLRHYHWQRPARPEGKAYRNGWEAIVAHAQHAVEFEGPAAERLKEMSDARVPWLMADDFVAAASYGEVYYALLGVPATSSELQGNLLGSIPPGPMIESYRAGSSSSGLSPNPRMVQRWGNTLGGFWLALDFADAERGRSIFSNPLSSEADATEVVFSLPNGLRGYAITDGAGQRAAVSPLPASVITDPSQRDGVMRNASSCFGCHNGGLIPFPDQVRERLPELSPELMDLALSLFPEPSVLDKLGEADDARYFAALEATGVPAGIEDPISRVYRGFWDEIALRQAAGELFVEPDVLRRELRLVPGPLAALATPSVSIARASFANAYVQALCTLHATSENRPAGCESLSR